MKIYTFYPFLDKLKSTFLIVFFLGVTQVLAQQQNSSNDKPLNLIYLQVGGNPSIFNIGYGIEFFSKKRISFEPKLGIGIDFLRFKPYNLEPLLKMRFNYKFKPQGKLEVFGEVGLQYIFNPWYTLDSAKYFPNCDTGRCPEEIWNYFFDIGVQYSFSNRLSLSAALFENIYEKSYYLLPGLELKYTFNEN